jgi:cysteine dioxygenase
MNEPITTLVDELVQCFERDPQGREAARALGRYASTHTDWRRYLRFDPQLYTRNLVARNEQFEMLVLCWSAGQESPIHDHAGQHCFMAVLQGRIEELQYARPESGSRARLKQTDRNIFEPGGVAYIHDRIALHKVRPCAGEPAVSLHLYAKPIDVCQVYDEETGTELSRQLIYHSVGV